MKINTASDVKPVESYSGKSLELAMVLGLKGSKDQDEADGRHNYSFYIHVYVPNFTIHYHKTKKFSNIEKRPMYCIILYRSD